MSGVDNNPAKLTTTQMSTPQTFNIGDSASADTGDLKSSSTKDSFSSYGAYDSSFANPLATGSMNKSFMDSSLTKIKPPEPERSRLDLMSSNEEPEPVLMSESKEAAKPAKTKDSIWTVSASVRGFYDSNLNTISSSTNAASENIKSGDTGFCASECSSEEIFDSRAQQQAKESSWTKGPSYDLPQKAVEYPEGIALRHAPGPSLELHPDYYKGQKASQFLKELNKDETKSLDSSSPATINTADGKIQSLAIQNSQNKSGFARSYNFNSTETGANIETTWENQDSTSHVEGSGAKLVIDSKSGQLNAAARAVQHDSGGKTIFNNQLMLNDRTLSTVEQAEQKQNQQASLRSGITRQQDNGISTAVNVSTNGTDTAVTGGLGYQSESVTAEVNAKDSGEVEARTVVDLTNDFTGDTKLAAITKDLDESSVALYRDKESDMLDGKLRSQSVLRSDFRADGEMKTMSTSELRYLREDKGISVAGFYGKGNGDRALSAFGEQKPAELEDKSMELGAELQKTYKNDDYENTFTAKAGLKNYGDGLDPAALFSYQQKDIRFGDSRGLDIELAENHQAITGSAGFNDDQINGELTAYNSAERGLGVRGSVRGTVNNFSAEGFVDVSERVQKAGLKGTHSSQFGELSIIAETKTRDNLPSETTASVQFKL